MQQKVAAANRPPHLPWTAWLVLGWALGSVLLIGRLLLGYLSLWLLRRRCALVANGDEFDLLQRLRRELNLRRPVELLRSPSRSMPMTWGLWQARMLLPQEASQWPAAQRRDVILHELGHLKRGDCLSQLLSQFTCSIYWFNPLAWIADRRMQVERERACDDLVLSCGADARSYARHLLQSVSLCSFPSFHLTGAAMAMARPSTLEERMQAILDARVSRSIPSTRFRAATVILLLTALVPVAILKAQAPQTPAGQEPPASNGTAGTTASRGEPSTARPASQIEPGEGPTCHFDATLYDLRLPVEQIGKLSVAALESAADNAESFENALAALGTPKPMYRANQSVRLSGDTIDIVSETPYVSNVMIGRGGQSIDRVSYSPTFAKFAMAGSPAASGQIDLDLSIQLSARSESGVSITGAGDKLQPIMHTSSLLHKGPVRQGKPFVVVIVNAEALDKDGKAVAYIARVTVGDLQSPVR